MIRVESGGGGKNMWMENYKVYNYQWICSWDFPIKNVTRILMEIPCHFSSQLDLVAVSFQIHTKFHDYSMSFIQVLFVYHSKTWQWILDKFKSWNFHDIYQENDGICIGFGLIFDQAAVKKTWENPCHIFYGECWRLANIFPVSNNWTFISLNCLVYVLTAQALTLHS